MDPLLWVVFLRAFERLGVVLVGALAIWIGYRLFVLLPRRREGEARIDLPGDVSVYVSRIAPGIFFALFGAGLIAHSATQPVSYADALRAFGDTGAAAAGDTGRHYLGVGAGLVQAETSPAGASIATEIVLRGLDAALDDAAGLGDSSRRLDIELAVREAKLALLRERWDADWGPYPVFHRWVVEEAARGAPPTEVALPAALFRDGAR